MTPVASAACGLSNPTRDDLQRQLYCYAQDLQELMQQYIALQQRNQIMRHALGRGDHPDDLLLGLLTQSINLYLVTDPQGIVTFASPAASHTFGRLGLTLKGQTILKLAARLQQPAFQMLLDKLASTKQSHAIEQRQLFFRDELDAQRSQGYEALIMSIHRNERSEIFWLFIEPIEVALSALTVQKMLPLMGDTPEGMLIVDPLGNIQAVNSAFTRITGYSAAEMLGKNPRLLSSGLQDHNFYQAFWQRLLSEGYWSGEVFNRRKNGQVYFEWLNIKTVKDGSGKTLSYLGAFADMSPNANDHKQLAQLAFHDTLTGLPNRRLLDSCITQALEAAKREGSDLAVMLLDLNRFRLVYDQLSHEQIDQVLLAVSTHLQTAVRPGDVVARLGDEEFAILLTTTCSATAIEDLANYILFLLNAPIALDHQAVDLQTNIGCARFPQDGSDAATLLRCADAAMYAARQFDLRFCFFDHGPAGSQPAAQTVS